MNFESIDYHTIIKIAHIAFNGPLLLYISLAKPNNIYIYYLLLIVGLAVLYTSLNKIMNNRGYKWLYIHLLIFVPVILRVGYFLSTSIFLVLSYIVLGERKWLWIFLLSFPFVAIFMYLLHGLLNIYLRDPFLQYIGVMG